MNVQEMVVYIIDDLHDDIDSDDVPVTYGTPNEPNVIDVEFESGTRLRITVEEL